MNVIQCGSSFETKELRRRLFNGDIVIIEPTSSSLELAALARDLVWEAFTPLNPLDAHSSIGPDEYATALKTAKSKLEQHPQTQRLVVGILADLRCNPATTLFSAPHLQCMPNEGYLSSGPTRPFQPHRDTWHGAPNMQINWWMPVFDMTPENGIAFHPEFWGRPVPNSSSEYNHDEWTAANRDASVAESVHPTIVGDVELDSIHNPSFKPILQTGGIVLFSAAHLHSTVVNRTDQTRFSIDFRTVDAEDVATFEGADNVDAEATGTTLRSFLSAATLEPLPSHVVAPYDTGQPFAISV
jgi:hypothetical protein